MAETKPRKRTRANGEGGVHKEAERGRWVGTITIGYTDAGKQVRRKVTGKTKKEVTDKLDLLRTATNAGLRPAPAQLTVAKFLTDWIERLPGKVRPLTVENYTQVAKRYVIPHIGQIRLTQLAPSDVDSMVHTLAEGDATTDPPRRPVSPNTQRAARSVLRRALRWAEAEGMVSRNVAKIAEGVHVGGGTGRTLTVEQAGTLLGAVHGNRYGAAVTTALALGLRRGELLGLSWSDLELDKKPSRLTVHRSLKRIPKVGLVLDDPKTEASKRTVHLPEQLAIVLKEHRKRQIEERLHAGPLWIADPLGADLVFRTPFGHAVDPDNFRQAVYRITKAAGLGQWSPHELRHSAASLLIAQGVELKLISEMLGHSSIRVTADVYGHLLDVGKARTAAAMGDVLWGAK